MIMYQGHIVIGRPVAEVFDYTTTVENFTNWSDTHSVKRLTNGALGVGSRLLLDMGRGPMRTQIEFETIAYEKDRRWDFKTISEGPIRWDGSYGFEPEGASSTRVRIEGQVTLRGWRRLLEPIVRAELRREEQAELERLKALIENGPES